MAIFGRRKRLDDPHLAPLADGCTPIADAPARRLVRVTGQVTKMRVRPTAHLPALAVTIADETGSATVVWSGRRSIGGVSLGRHLTIEGVAVRRGDRLEFSNPTYTLLPGKAH